jgi:hypothetical protein
MTAIPAMTAMTAKSNQSEGSNQIINNKIFLKSVREINNTGSGRVVMLPMPTATIQGVTQGGNGSRTITKVVRTISMTCRNINIFCNAVQDRKVGLIVIRIYKFVIYVPRFYWVELGGSSILTTNHH